MDWFKSSVICVYSTVFLCFGGTEARDYCGRSNGKDIYCDEGQCCGEFDCCTYYKYYKMWWFWLVFALLSLLACCCAYHRRHNFAYHWQIRSFVYSTALRGETEPTTSYQQLDNDPKYKLPSYAEVEAMGSLDPPADGDGAPPPYVDPLANEELQEDATISQENSAEESTDGLRICLVTQDTEVQSTETV